MCGFTSLSDDSKACSSLRTTRSYRNKTGGRGTMQEIGAIISVGLYKKLQRELEDSGIISEARPTAMFVQRKQVRLLK